MNIMKAVIFWAAVVATAWVMVKVLKITMAWFVVLLAAVGIGICNILMTNMTDAVTTLQDGPIIDAQ